MSSTPQPTAATHRPGTRTGPLQAVLAAVAVCVLYWAVGINETPAAASGSSAPAAHVQQGGSSLTAGSAVPGSGFAPGRAR